MFNSFPLMSWVWFSFSRSPHCPALFLSTKANISGDEHLTSHQRHLKMGRKMRKSWTQWFIAFYNCYICSSLALSGSASCNLSPFLTALFGSFIVIINMGFFLSFFFFELLFFYLWKKVPLRWWKGWLLFVLLFFLQENKKTLASLLYLELVQTNFLFTSPPIATIKSRVRISKSLRFGTPWMSFFGSCQGWPHVYRLFFICTVWA